MDVWHTRTWKWFAARVEGLLTRPPATYRPDGAVIPSTRLGLLLNPPEPPRKQ